MLVTYKGRPVKKHFAAPSGNVLLLLVNPRKGGPSQKLEVSQADWQAHSRETYYEKGAMPDVRLLAANHRHNT